jgi:3-oxoacyl-[acyl-carrier protein] reductase
MIQEPTKFVVVTGVSGGLGESIVHNLIESNYNVIGVSRRQPQISFRSDLESRFTYLSHDLSEIENLHNLVSKIKKLNGQIYGLINNAAIGKDGVLPTLHNTDIEYQIRLNLTSPIMLTKYLSREMLMGREGRIINISSVVANSGYRGLSVYAATKAGLEGFTRSLSRELGSYGITVNCVAPGFMETEMTSTLKPTDLDRIKSRSALKRFPTLTEVAMATKFLLDPSSAGITGTVITVDAGNTA